jgi:hypothetical protein
VPVIVNELEVVVAPADPGTGQPPSGSPAQSPSPPITPLELAELLERRARHALRLMAH